MKRDERYNQNTPCEYCKYSLTNYTICDLCANFDEYICREIDHCKTFALWGNCKGCGSNYHKLNKPSTTSFYTNGIYESNWQIKNVIFNDPATIVFWSDGTKTVVKAQEDDVFDPEKGLAMAIAKKAMGNKGRYYNEIKKWVDPYYEKLDDNFKREVIGRLVSFDKDDNGIFARIGFNSYIAAEKLMKAVKSMEQSMEIRFENKEDK